MENDNPTPKSPAAIPPQLISPSEPLPKPSVESVDTGAAVQRDSSSVVPEPIGSTSDEAAKREFLWHTHEYVNEYVRFADTKAALAGAIASTLVGALYTAK